MLYVLLSRLQAKQKRDYSCTSWTDYFSKEESIQAEGSKDIFHSYKRGDTGPFVIFLHGGGFSGLSWSLLAVCVLIGISHSNLKFLPFPRVG